MKNYFENLEKGEAAKLYKVLAGTHHPLKGGAPEIWLLITAQFKALQDAPDAPEAQTPAAEEKAPERAPEEAPAPRAARKNSPEDEEAIKAAALFAHNLAGVKVEIMGTWVWATGNTKPHCKELKAAGFLWAKKKERLDAWFFRTGDNKSRKRSGRKMPIDDIKKKYGVKELF